MIVVLKITDWFLVGFFVLSVINTIAHIGKPRPPFTSSDATFIFVFTSVIVGLLLAGLLYS